MYTTTDDWKNHLKTSHGVSNWICDICWFEGANVSEFSLEEEWRDHMMTKHREDYDETDLSDLAQAQRRTVIPPVSCPLCYDGTPLLQLETDKHISEHLHSFALQALPWEIGPEDVSRASIGSNIKNELSELDDTSDDDLDEANNREELNSLPSLTSTILNCCTNLAAKEEVASSTETLSTLTTLKQTLQILSEHFKRYSSDDCQEIAACLRHLELSFQRYTSDDVISKQALESLEADIVTRLISLKAFAELEESVQDDFRMNAKVTEKALQEFANQSVALNSLGNWLDDTTTLVRYEPEPLNLGSVEDGSSGSEPNPEPLNLGSVEDGSSGSEPNPEPLNLGSVGDGSSGSEPNPEPPNLGSIIKDGSSGSEPNPEPPNLGSVIKDSSSGSEPNPEPPNLGSIIEDGSSGSEPNLEPPNLGSIIEDGSLGSEPNPEPPNLGSIIEDGSSGSEPNPEPPNLGSIIEDGSSGSEPNLEPRVQQQTEIPPKTSSGSKALRKLLRASLVTCEHNRTGEKRFIPRRQLAIICNMKAVVQELKKAFPGSDPGFCEQLASLICHGQPQSSISTHKPCLKIFAILVLINEAGLIGFFQERSLCDDDLPFHSTPDFEKMWPNEKGEGDYLQFSDEVDDEFVENFVRVQWQLLAPSFERPKSSSLRCNFYEFDDKTILPITNVSQNKHTGGFGVVERVQLHEEHHEFEHSHFALKTFHSMMPFDLKSALFNQELKAFQQAKPGSHLIDVCAAFKKGENYHFLFPWADGGTINHLWTKDPQTIVSEKQVQWAELGQWACKQCHGIIRDLQAIHEPHDASQTGDDADDDDLYGIHSDIKPDNILHFTDDGTPLGILKVSDLGLMKFHRLISRTKHSQSMGAAYQTYRSPEHDTGMMRSRKVDIWAFGCLFAEFITWVIAGRGGIDHFRNMRVDEDKRFPDPKKGEWYEDHFFTMRNGEPEQKHSVAQWFAHLGEGLGKDTFFPQFLSFIQNSMLHPDRDARVDCKKVEQFLEKCLRNNPDSSYWLFDGRLMERYSRSRSSTNSSSWSRD
ncbi:hypothetical protein HDV64DRAFT_166552 [Trichoderma sp. TUCIM 5745]